MRMVHYQVYNTRQGRRKRFWMLTMGSILASLAMSFVISVVDEIPGGMADRRMSHAMKLEAVLRIPLGATPDEAVHKFWGTPWTTVIHREPVKGGMLVFIKRDFSEDSDSLRIEYVRKTWLGWKWVYGGEYSIGIDMSSKPSIAYMSMPSIIGIRSPFPMLFGSIIDPSIKQVTISSSSNKDREYKAKLVNAKERQTIWLAFLPSDAAVPYEISALNTQGDLVGSQIINDSRGSGLIP
ncbi:MAG: hypothetical protein K0Q73_3307 [Paenibacillus sp.]|nr:hypothetical protein [Paenibacillus sp.]